VKSEPAPPATPVHPAEVQPAPRRVALRKATQLATLALGGGLVACAPAGASADAVTLEQARAEHEAGSALLIDIREPAEHATGVAAGAKLIPMSQLGRRLAEIPTDTSQPVLLICNTQNRSGATLKALRERGYAHVRYVDGGMSAWARRGWPMVKPTPTP
jgi:rhodanese-related sulfurtransferase